MASVRWKEAFAVSASPPHLGAQWDLSLAVLATSSPAQSMPSAEKERSAALGAEDASSLSQ